MTDVAAPRAWLRFTGPSGTVVSACLGGEIDIASLPDLEPDLGTLLSEPPKRLVMDLSELDFVDSSGVAVLIRLANHFDPVELRAAHPNVRRVIEVLGLADRLGMAPGESVG